MPTVAELVFGIVYGAPDKGPLNQAVEDARKAADKASAPWVTAGRVIAGGLTAMAGATVAAGVGLFALVDKSTAAADAVIKSARNAGTAADEFQRLAHAAKLSDVDTGVLTRTLQDLNRNLARKDAPKDFVDALGQIGLTTADLSGSATENLGKIFDALNDVADESERSALSVLLLGRGGRQMASLIEGGSAGLRAMGDEAERLGLVIEDEALVAAESFQDSLTRLEDTVGAVATKIGVEAAPAVENIVVQTTEWVATNDELIQQNMDQAIQGFGNALQAVLPHITTLIGALGDLAFEAGAVIDILTLDDEDFKPEDVVGAENFVQAVENRRIRLASEANTARVNRKIKQDQQRAERERAQREAREIRDSIAGPTLEEGGLKFNRATGRVESKNKKRRGSGRRRGGAVDFSAEDFELLEAEELLGDDITALAASVSATDVQRQAALEAASAQIARGAAPGVARQAAASTLESLTGGKVRTNDRTLSDLLGSDVPDIELSALARGAEPQVLVSTISNTFTFHNDIDVDGAGDPVAVAHRAVDVMVDTFQGQVRQATKTVKVDYAR